jgi:predicted glutamine amidotransferase
MCRLLGVVSATPQPLTDLLRNDVEQFTQLSSVHCDGWGAAHWDGRGSLQVRKAPEAARSSAGYRAAIEEAHTDAAILHLRRASPGMVNSAANTHPFTAGRVAFAHNGWADDLSALDAAVAAAGEPPCQGSTDSERYFGLVTAAMRTVPPEVALTAVAAHVYATMRTEALNCLLLTEDSLYAFTSFDPTRPTASGNNPADAYRLGFRVTDKSVIVASSGWEHGTEPWEPLPNGQVLRVRRKDLHVSVHRVVPSFAAAAVGLPTTYPSTAAG